MQYYTRNICQTIHLTREYIFIGNRATGFRRFVRDNDFRASGSFRFDFDPVNIDPRCIEISFSISRKFNFSAMGYDFLFDENNKPYISEFGYCFADYVIEKLPGYWDDKLVWHEEKNWPQYYQLADFLQTDLKYGCECTGDEEHENYPHF